tara:strand:+ start:1057 stop:2007 length:951 start_codon:yes stop_codon:yes gene_type:complete
MSLVITAPLSATTPTACPPLNADTTGALEAGSTAPAITVVNLADLPKHIEPDGFRTSSKGKLIPEAYDTDSHSAKRNRFIDRETGEVLDEPVPDSESSWYKFQQRFNGANNNPVWAVQPRVDGVGHDGVDARFAEPSDPPDSYYAEDVDDATTDCSERSSAASDYCHRCKDCHDGGSAAIMNKDPNFRVCVDCATDEEMVEWGQEKELTERKERDAWAAGRWEAPRFREPDDEPSDTNPEDVDAEYAFERGLGVKRNHADDYGPEDASEDEEDAVPGTPPPPKRPRIDPNYVPETPSAGSPSTASPRSIFVPQSPM